MRFQLYYAIMAAFLLLATPSVLCAQAEPAPSTFGAAKEISLYPGIAPGSESWNYSEVAIEGKAGPQVFNVVRPTLLHFPAPRSVGTAVIVAPGGGRRTLMMGYEGVDVAKKLNDAGVDAFVLKYRLVYVPSVAKDNDTKNPQAGQDIGDLSGADGRKAVDLIRSRATEFNIDPQRIGMIGFSAGGGPIRAAMNGNAATRPDFVALIYAAGRRVGAPLPHPDGAPPLFLAVSADDHPVGYEGSIDTFLAWQAAGVPAELHIFQMGAHGFVNKGGGADHLMDRVEEWMRINGWLSRANTPPK